MFQSRKGIMRYRSLTTLPLAAAMFGVCSGWGGAKSEAALWVGTSADMNVAANWSPAGVPGNGGSMEFDGSSAFNNLTTNVTLGSATNGLSGGMTVLGTQADPLSITNVGTAGLVGIRFANNTGVNIQAGAGAVTFGGANNSYIINHTGNASNFGYTNNSASLATISSNVQLNATGGSTPTINFDGSGDWLHAGTFSGSISGVTKSGAGLLTLSGNSSAFTGPITVNAGTLRVGNTGALGTAAGSTTINVGATLDVNGTNIQNEPIFVGGTITNTGGEIQSALGNVTLIGDTTLAGSGSRYDIRGTGRTLNLGVFTATKTGTNKIAFADNTIAGTGSVVVNAGTLGVTRAIWNGGSNLVMNAGTTLQFENNANNAAANYTMGVTLNSATMTTTGQSANLNSNFTLTGANIIDVATNQTQTIHGAVGGLGGFTKIGGGTLLIHGASNYAGNTVVNIGTFGGSGSAASNTSLAANTTLTPGGIGALGAFDANNLTFANNAIYHWDYLGTASDVTDVLGTLAFGNNLTLIINSLDGGLLATGGHEYVLFTYGGVDPVLPNFNIQYAGDSELAVRLSGNSVLLSVVIPEPATLSLLVLGGLGLLRRRRTV